MNKLKLLALTVALLTTVGCSQTGSQIGVSPQLCCPGDYGSYSSYSLSTEGIPIFLRDYVVAEFERAFAEKGLERSVNNSDVEVVLAYNHINLYPEQQEIDPFIRVESLSVELSYVAQIEIRIKESATSNPVWAGAISRIHHVSPGEYMHETRAAPAFYQAFVEVLASYPAAL